MCAEAVRNLRQLFAREGVGTDAEMVSKIETALQELDEGAWKPRENARSVFVGEHELAKAMTQHVLVTMRGK